MASRKRHFHISWMKMKTACLCAKMPPAPTAAACCSEPVTHIVAVWLHGVTEKNWMYCMAMLEPSRIQTSAKCRGRFVAFYARQQTRQTAFNRRSRSDRPRYASKPFTRDGLRRCRWPQPRHDVRLAELASLMAPHLHANARYKPVQIQHSALCLMPAWCRSRKTAFVVSGGFRKGRAGSTPPPALWATDRRRHGSLLLTEDNGYTVSRLRHRQVTATHHYLYLQTRLVKTTRSQCEIVK